MPSGRSLAALALCAACRADPVDIADGSVAADAALADAALADAALADATRTDAAARADATFDATPPDARADAPPSPVVEVACAGATPA